MKISVVVCTRDRHDTIGQAIESIAQCDYPDFDIHIMDQSTTEGTKLIIEEIAPRHASQCPILYHHLDKAGLSRSYNAGMRVSAGEIIAFTDDDVIVPKDWLTQIAKAFTEDPDLALLYGQVCIPESLKSAAAEGIIVPALVFDKPKRLIKGSAFKVFGMGANMAIRRTLLEEVEGFDEALGGGGPLRSAQDYDFAYRTFLTGKAILLEPKVWVDHYGTRTQDQWPLTLKNYGIGDGAFYAKHIRCGDLRLLWIYIKLYLRCKAREIKRLFETGEWQTDIYGQFLPVGFQEAAKFDIDRKYRLYRESETGKMTVTQASTITGAQRNTSSEQKAG